MNTKSIISALVLLAIATAAWAIGTTTNFKTDPSSLCEQIAYDNALIDPTFDFDNPGSKPGTRECALLDQFFADPTQLDTILTGGGPNGTDWTIVRTYGAQVDTLFFTRRP